MSQLDIQLKTCDPLECPGTCCDGLCLPKTLLGGQAKLFCNNDTDTLMLKSSVLEKDVQACPSLCQRATLKNQEMVSNPLSLNGENLTCTCAASGIIGERKGRTDPLDLRREDYLVIKTFDLNTEQPLKKDIIYSLPQSEPRSKWWILGILVILFLVYLLVKRF